MAIEDVSEKAPDDAAQATSARRKLLAFGAAGFGLIASGALGAGKAAASHTPPLEGSSDLSGVPGVEGEHHTDGPGVFGHSASGAGVRGETTSSGNAGVEGHNNDTGFNAAGVRGTIAAPAGRGMGVDGQSFDGVGVSGTSHNYIGVSAGSLRGVAFEAFSIGHRAINVAGKAGFSSVGAGTVPAGSDSAVVTHLDVTADSHVTVVLTSDPRNSAVVQWIERTPGAGFTLHLDRRVRDATGFSFFIVEPFAPLTGPVTP